MTGRRGNLIFSRGSNSLTQSALGSIIGYINIMLHRALCCVGNDLLNGLRLSDQLTLIMNRFYAECVLWLPLRKQIIIYAQVERHYELNCNRANGLITGKHLLALDSLSVVSRLWPTYVNDDGHSDEIDDKDTYAESLGCLLSRWCCATGFLGLVDLERC
jgi:hypothetical protein